MAKLALILADKETDLKTKLGCIKLAIRMGFITEAEGVSLLAYRSELEEFMESEV